MNSTQELKALSDDELIRRLSNLLRQSRRTEAELAAHIGEVDERRLFARECSSMFAYCVEVLHLSEPEAYLRIGVARAARKYPLLLTMLGDGRLHLSGNIPAAVRRAVRERDGDRCRFVSEHGRRCTERRGLEFHHHDPFGRGGDHHPANVSLMHHAHLAKREYGNDAMKAYRDIGSRVSETALVYGVIDPRLAAVQLRPDGVGGKAPRSPIRADRQSAVSWYAHERSAIGAL